MRGRYVGARMAKKPNHHGKKPWVIPAAIAAGLLLLALLVGCVLLWSSAIYPNVSIGDVQVGGMSHDVAVRAIESAAAQTYGKTPLVMELQDRTVTIRPEDSAVTIDSETAITLAHDYGRESGPLTALIKWLGSSEPHQVAVADALTFEEDFLRKTAQEVAAAVECEMIQPTVDFDEEAGTITVVTGTAGKHLDADAFYDAMVEAYGKGEFRSRFDYDLEPFDPVDLTDLYKAHCTPMVNAEYKEDTHELIREQVGFGFDLEAEHQRIRQADEGETLVITLGDMIPEVTIDTLQQELFPDTLGAYDSNHTNIPDRTHNLDLACHAIDGTILNPGEVFSFNQAVGERTAEKGYRAATVYLGGGESKPELGGGVCQVASTIYMCTLLADLDVVERTEHMFAVTYVPMGMDATVYWGSLDFKFRNSTQTPLLLRTSVSGGQVHVSLRGKKTSDKTVEMTYTTLATIPWEEVEQVDETKAPEYREVTVTPYTGYRVQTYKNYYDKAGNLLSTEKCAYSSYHKRDKIITVGPQPEEVPEVTEIPTEALSPTPPAPEAPPATETPTAEGAPVTEPPAEAAPPAEAPAAETSEGAPAAEA